MMLLKRLTNKKPIIDPILKVWEQNYKNNLELNIFKKYTSIEILKGSATRKIAVLCLDGPSLDKDLISLKKIQEYVHIISMDAVFYNLYKKGNGFHIQPECGLI